MAKNEEIRINLKKRNVFVFAIVIAIFVLALPTLLRFYAGNDSFVGSESYYHFRAAGELINEGSYNMFDPPEGIKDRSYDPRDYFFNPYHYLLVYLSTFMSLATASRIVPLLLGIFSLLVFNLILKRFIGEDYKRHVVLVLLAVNPAFIYAFTVSNQHCGAIALTLLGFYFFMKDEQYNILLSALCFAVVSLFSWFNTFLVLVILLAFIASRRVKQGRFVIMLLLLAILSLTKQISFYYNYSYAPGINIVGNLFSDLGGMMGFGIFTIVLAVYGVSSHWKSKSHFIAYLALALLLLAALFIIGSVVNMYLMFLIAIAAGLGFVRLYEIQWNAPTVKNLTMLILVCGLLFSATSYMTRLSSMEPENSTIDALDWLSANAFKDEFVLSHYDNGYFISTIARNPVIADPLLTSGYDQKFLYKVQDSMFYSRKLSTTKQLLDAYEIEYIYVTPEMKQGQVWSRPDEGLLFLFSSPSTFEKVYDKDGYEIWKVLNTTVS